MQLEKITDNILYFKCDSQKELVLTFCRIQEFYESPHERIRGRRFDFYDFLEAYTGIMGRFSYFTDWGGFNFPSDIFYSWYRTTPDISPSEQKLINSILIEFNEPLMKTLLYSKEKKHPPKFYVIASCEDGRTKEHELAHAMFFLNQTYQRKVEKLIKTLPTDIYSRMLKRLAKMGYDQSVWNDEVNAYLSTSDNNYLNELFQLTSKECANANKLRSLFKMNKKTMGIQNVRTKSKNS